MGDHGLLQLTRQQMRVGLTDPGAETPGSDAAYTVAVKVIYQLQ